MEEESEYYVIISKDGDKDEDKDGEKVMLSTGRLNPKDYNFVLKRSHREQTVIFDRYRISERNHKLVIKALDKIHFRPYSEVSGDVKGLITKLEGETQ